MKKKYLVIYFPRKNSLRINFTTDGRVEARGFRLRWEAVCGDVVYRTNHGKVN